MLSPPRARQSSSTRYPSKPKEWTHGRRATETRAAEVAAAVALSSARAAGGLRTSAVRERLPTPRRRRADSRCFLRAPPPRPDPIRHCRCQPHSQSRLTHSVTLPSSAPTCFHPIPERDGRSRVVQGRPPSMRMGCEWSAEGDRRSPSPASSSKVKSRDLSAPRHSKKGKAVSVFKNIDISARDDKHSI